MFERPSSGERAVLVHVDFPPVPDPEALAEFEVLAGSAAVTPVAVVSGSRQAPDPKYFVGSGKADEVRRFVTGEAAEVVLFNHSLTPAQGRNLERLFGCRVLDRTELILDIFAQRARSHEGKLQVELAQLRHLSTRLVRGWTHLERQKGGIGLRGPGETQLETDRRLLGIRIKQLNKRLAKVQRQRDQGRRARRRAELPTVSLVGYTNAGKSTLFNRLTHAEVYAANKLFATLDPTLRRVKPDSGEPFVLADTVGFIRDLPHDLVAAFRSTLQETQEADLLLHVIDAEDDNHAVTVEQVNRVLAEIGADEVPQIEVYNKLDRLPDTEPRIEYDAEGRPRRVWVSALDGRGLDLLTRAITEFLRADLIRELVRVPPEAGRLRAALYARGAVRSEQVDAEGNCLLEIEIERTALNALRRREGLAGEDALQTQSCLATAGQAP